MNYYQCIKLNYIIFHKVMKTVDTIDTKHGNIIPILT